VGAPPNRDTIRERGDPKEEKMVRENFSMAHKDWENVEGEKYIT